MIPILPEPSAGRGALNGAGAAVLSQAGAPLRDSGAALDFAGLLHAAMPAEVSALPGGGEGEVAPNSPAVPMPLPPAAELLHELPAPAPAVLLAAPLPGGTILPDSGASLPQSAALAEGEAEAVPVDPPVALTPDTLPPVGGLPVPMPMPNAVEAADITEPAPTSPIAPENADATSADAAAALAIDAPVIVAPAPPPLAVAPILAQTTIVSAAPARPASRAMPHPAVPTVQPGNAPMPESTAPLPEPALVPDAPSSAAPAAPAPLLAEAPAPVSASATQLATTPAATFATAPPAAVVAAAANPAEPRALAPNQESTIAAVGEIREALRAARPEMTLRHTEFGFVSLRLEPMVAGQQDWRAVLASRDPGFIPAIQTALAERAVAATSDSAGTGPNTGQNTGQNGASDQRYGSSPNGGQGSSQPYFGHSSDRGDGGSPPRNGRQPSTTDAVASQAGEPDAERGDLRKRGVFA